MGKGGKKENDDEDEDDEAFSSDLIVGKLTSSFGTTGKFKVIFPPKTNVRVKDGLILPMHKNIFDKTSNRVLALKHSEFENFDIGFGFLVKFHLIWYFFRP